MAGTAATSAGAIAAIAAAVRRDGWSRIDPPEDDQAVEAHFGTKAALLQTVVDFAIRGDLDSTPMPRRDVVRSMEDAPTAAAMLARHASHLRSINERSAPIARAVEEAAGRHPAVEKLWERMNSNRSFAVAWAVRTVSAKPGLRSGLSQRELETILWVAIDWGTYRTLTTHAGLDADGYEEWLRAYYAATLIGSGPRRRPAAPDRT